MGEFTSERAMIFFLVFTRMAGLIFFAPFLSERAIPRKVKIAFSIVLAVMTFGSVGARPAITSALGNMVAAIGVEFLTGASIGLAVQMMLAAVRVAGELIGHDIGFAIVNTVDPVTDRQVSVIGQAQYFLALLIFLALGGDAIMMKALVGSYEVVPLGGGAITPEFVTVMVDLAGNMFELAIKVAAPAVAILFLVTVALGFLARTLPQMNVLIVGFPLRIGVGLAMLMITLPVLYMAMERVVADAPGQVGQVLRVLSVER